MNFPRLIPETLFPSCPMYTTPFPHQVPSNLLYQKQFPFLSQVHFPLSIPETLPSSKPRHTFPLLTPNKLPPPHPRYGFPLLPRIHFLPFTPSYCKAFAAFQEKSDKCLKMLPRYEEGWTCREKLTRHIVVWISTTSRDCSNIFSHKTLIFSCYFLFDNDIIYCTRPQLFKRLSVPRQNEKEERKKG